MNIIKTFLRFVNPLLGSKLFWAVVCGLVLLLWLVKFDLSKAWKITNLLGKFVVNLFALFLALSLWPFVKTFQETEKI